MMFVPVVAAMTLEKMGQFIIIKPKMGCSQEALRQLKQQQERQGNSDDTKGAKRDHAVPRFQRDRQEANKK
ncbi:MAG: hypothetical protein AB4368_08265 [Xenococcaceae cyanobacterium]